MINKTKCVGCEDDFYNHDAKGGKDGCWERKDAEIIQRKKVHMSQVPPWNQAPKKYPSCYHQKQYVFVGKDQTY